MIRPPPKAALLAAALLVPACGPPPGGDHAGRGVLIIVVDALRADHVSGDGYDRKTTPYLEGLALEGTRFRSAYAASPDVLPSHAAILSGCDPMLARRIPVGAPSLGTAVTDWYVPDDLPRLPRAFLASGFTTAAFVDHPAISPVCGFGAGFQQFSGFDAAPDLEATDTAAKGFEGVSTRFLNWVSGLGASQDWFAYLQFDDLERLWLRPDQKWDTFFEPRPELAAVPPIAEDECVFFALARDRWDGGARSLGQLEARYDGALRQLDQNFGRLFEKLRRTGRWDRTTIVVVGSHGIGFGESGVIADSGTFSDCDLGVPLILRPARGLPVPEESRGRTTDWLASLVDLAPTLLELHGIPRTAGIQGASLVGALRGEPDPEDKRLFAAGGRQSGFAVIEPRFCFEESSPGGLAQEAASPLSRSWYGDGRDHRREVRRFLHGRAADAMRRGHLGPCLEDPENSERLARAGREHYDWIETERQALHAGPADR
jgi:arylsulfatase A-like enzyme